MGISEEVRGSEQLPDRQSRLARNQALFRDVNETVNEVSAGWRQSADPDTDWVCECASETCSVRMPLTHFEYEAVRANPTHFAVAPADSHVFLEVERVVERNDRYWVVEKIKEAGRVAEHFDPRSRSKPVMPKVEA